MLSSPSILIVRHPTKMTRFYDVVLNWMANHAPECRDHFEVKNLPCDVTDWGKLRLLVPWLQDPVQAWSPDTYDLIEKMADQCESRGIPVINRARNLVNAGKTAAAEIISKSGFRTPRTLRILDMQAFRQDFNGMSVPFFVREDWGHGSAILRANTLDEARALPLESFKRPVVTELVDVRDARDGLFRKYRYFAAGEHGVAQHLQCSEEWITRGAGRVFTDATRDEELAYIARQDPHHARFQAARGALGLDVAAFDYGYDKDGNVVVWEVNPFPYIAFGRTTSTYRNVAIHRSIAAMLASYCSLARLPVPLKLRQFLEY